MRALIIPEGQNWPWVKIGPEFVIHEFHSASNQWQFYCVFNNLFMLTTKKTLQLCSIGSLRWESTSQKGLLCRQKSMWWHYDVLVLLSSVHYKHQAYPVMLWHGLVPFWSNGMEITTITEARITQLFMDAQKATIYYVQLGNRPGLHLNIKAVFPRYWDSHVKDKLIARPCYLKHGYPFTGKTTSLYWDIPRIFAPASSLK